MKSAVVFLFLGVSVFGLSAFAQQKVRYGQEQGRVAPSCGPANVNYKVNLDRSQHGPVTPQAGKALVYFFHEAGTPGTNLIAYPTTRYGLDGNWVGADHGDSWFAIAVDPGEHHVCTALQTSVFQQRVELGQFTAEAGKSYYFRTRLVLSGTVELLELNQIGSDEASYLYSEYPMAAATAKK